jgi:hypothetical protein
VDEVCRNRLSLRPEAGLQDIAAEEVHVVRHPVGVAHNGLEGPLGEERSPRQGHLGHALADIRQAFGLRHGADRGVDDAARRHTAASPALQVLQQLWLTDQDNREEGLLGGGQVREQRQLLDGLAG